MFELSRYVTIGQYLPTGSPIHRMDPRFKLLAFVIWVCAISFTARLAAHVFLLVGVLTLVAISKIPQKFAWSGIRPAVPILVIMFIIQILFYQTGGAHVLWQFGWLSVSQGGIIQAIVNTLRFIEIVLLISVLSLSTVLSDLTHAIEQLLRPLRALRFPAHEIALIVTIALRFVPTFAQEGEKLMKAQAARGAGFGTARWWQWVKRTKNVFPIVLPLFLNAMRRAEDLTMAMEARGYSPGAPRTSYVAFAQTWLDYLYFALCLAFCVVVLWIHWPI